MFNIGRLYCNLGAYKKRNDMKNQRVRTGVHHINGLGCVIISGMVNASCSVMPEPRTVVEEVLFFSSSNLQTVCRPELWEPYEKQLEGVLRVFGEVDRYIEYSKNLGGIET